MSSPERPARSESVSPGRHGSAHYGFRPELQRLTPGAILQWRQDYESYLSEIEAANRGKSAQNRINPRSKKDCIYSGLVKEFERNQSKETDPELKELDFEDYLLKKLDSFINASEKDGIALALAGTLNEVRLHYSTKDVYARVVEFKASLALALERAGVKDPDALYEDKDRFGPCLEVLVNRDGIIHPRCLRSWIRLRLRSEGKKMTMERFEAILTESLSALDLVEKMENAANHGDSRSPSPMKRPYDDSPEVDGHRELSKAYDSYPNRPSPPRRNKRPVDHIPLPRGISKGIKPKSSKKRKTKKPSESKIPHCWGCMADGHVLSDCHIVTNEEERVQIVKRRNALRKNKVYSKYFKVLSVANEPIGTYPIKLNGRPHEVLLDDGADRSMISRRDVPPGAIEVALIEPIKVLLGDETSFMETSSYTELDIEIPLYDGLFLKGSPFFILEQDLSNPIVGHSELIKLGIDVKSTLDRLNKLPVDDDVQEEALFTEDEDVLFSESTLDQALVAMLHRAKAKIPQMWYSRLKSLIYKYKAVFRVSLGKDPPANVIPMDIEYKPGMEATTWTPYSLRYTEEELLWLKEHINALETNGFIYRNPHAKKASPALVIKKPGGGYRLCVDVKKANSQIIEGQWPMPLMENILQRLAGSSAFAKLDAFKGYWTFPVTPKCGNLYSIRTPFGVFTPRRIVQGAADSVKYFQSGMEDALHIHDRDDLILWVDDILAYGRDVSSLIDTLEYVFQCCVERNILLSAHKCELYLEDVSWCGRLINAQGIQFDPAYLQGIESIDFPKTVGDLQQFICSMNWIRSSIPRYNEEMFALQECLKQLTSIIGSNKKAVLARRQLSSYDIWNDEIKQAFIKAKGLLKTSIMNVHRDVSQRLCLYPDASDNFWGLFVTQVPMEDLNLKHELQRHSPLVILSGAFTSSQLRWHIKEKEAYPIMVGISKLRDLLQNPQGFVIYTDHKNLIHILDPSGRNIAKHSDDRLSRWAIHLLSHKFAIHHIDGSDNVVADMLSRWRINYPQHVRAANFQPGFSARIEQITWPSLSHISETQAKHINDEIVHHYKLQKSMMNGIPIYLKAQELYIPDDKELKLRLIVIAHSGSNGHRGVNQTLRNLNKFYWQDKRTDVQQFCKLCLHCAVADSREIVPRPFGEQMHATERNEILHYDFIHIGTAWAEPHYKYMLVIKDDYSGYINLYPAISPDHEVVVDSLLNWYSLFGISLIHISDRGSHFKNKVITSLNERLRVKHHFTLPYAPWSNGTVEVANRFIRKLIKVWVSEFRIHLNQWPLLIPVMVHVLNYSVSPRTGYTPAKLFGNFETKNPLSLIYSNKNKEILTISKNFKELSADVAEVQKSLDIIHKSVDSKTSRRGRGANKASAKLPNYSVGDYVLCATLSEKQGPSRRSRLKWKGPYQIVKQSSDWDFTIKHLVSSKCMQAHACRLKFYCDSQLNVTADLQQQIMHDQNQNGYTVESIVGHSATHLHIKWLGFDEQDNTWEPFDIIKEDIPDMVREYLSNLDDQDKFKNLLLNHLI